MARLKIVSKVRKLSIPGHAGTLEEYDDVPKVIAVAADGTEHELENVMGVMINLVAGHAPICVVNLHAPDIDFEGDGEVLSRASAETIKSPPPAPFRGTMGEQWIEPYDLNDYQERLLEGGGKLSDSTPPSLDIPLSTRAKGTERDGTEIEGVIVEVRSDEQGPAVCITHMAEGVRRRSWVPAAMIKIWDEARGAYIDPPEFWTGPKSEPR